MKSVVLLVSGTDTGVGKTFIGCRLLASLREQGLRVGAVKPVETGFTQVAGSDAEALRIAAGGWQTLSQVLPYNFPQPLAPQVAAAQSKVEINRKRVVQHVIEVAAEVDFLLVEGAGGLMVPFARDWRFIDLAQELQQPLLLVVGSRLGAINHAVLSFEALSQRRIASPGYVLNEIAGSNELAGSSEADTQAVLGATNREVIADQAVSYSFKELCYMPHLASDSTSHSDQVRTASRQDEEGVRISPVEEAASRLGRTVAEYFGLTH